MRIAFVSHNRCGLNMGGLQRQIFRTMEALEGLGHEVVLWNSWERMQAREYDIAHFFTADHSLLPVQQAFAALDIPTVLSPVLGVGNLGVGKQKLRRDLALSRFPVYQDLSRVISLVRQASMVVALHDKEQSLCEFYGRTLPIICVPNGVADVFLRGRPNKGHQLAGTNTYFLHVGQFWPNKGQRWLIDSWSDIDADLVLVGEAPVGHADYHSACQEAAKGRRIRFLGGFPPDTQELADLYSGAKGLILNSQSEVAPIVINEAFAAGTAVVMPRHLISDRERVPDAAFNQGDLKSFREALSTVRVTNGARATVTWTDVARRLEGVYEVVSK